VYTLHTCHEIAQVAHPLAPNVLSPCVEVHVRFLWATKGKAMKSFVEGC